MTAQRPCVLIMKLIPHPSDAAQCVGGQAIVNVQPIQMYIVSSECGHAQWIVPQSMSKNIVRTLKLIPHPSDAAKCVGG